ncbi:30S ribosomal protein S1 [Agrilactobacillus fermenti]|uniref:30S ribosomal protein S1 n=1 Tax=Agrilactobacillus fermenti TaxID=2586909 RepID=UPI001E332E08|nr:30S ribosomal protein S1 [Agrilactobacillus fermenti]MCD2255212.1 30S ribosomal protein S1 [Agrilactobacillus fermenti]
MSEDTNTNNSKELMEDALNSVHDVKIGDVVVGEVLAIDDNQLIVGIEGTGVEGVVPLKELTGDPSANINDQAKVGDKLDLVVISSMGKDKENGSYLLSKRRLEARKVWDEIEQEYKDGNTIKATVTNVVKGGLVVDAGVRGFIPASMVEDHYVEDLNEYKGKELELQIMEIEPSENRLILSHRAIVQKEKEAKKAETMAKLVPGDIIEGKVARLTNFGAFVDLGGVDGLVHVSEISYDHVDQPSDVLKVGQEVKVKVLNVDIEKERISLSIKATLPEPWTNIEDKAPVGAILDGTVRRLTTFGAFVEVFPGVEGLVHISQISHKHIATPNDVLKEGQEVKVKVLSVDPEQHRLALSIKALEEPEAESHEAHEDHASAPKAAPKTSSSANDVDDDSGFSIGDMVGDALKHSTDNQD